MHPLDINQVKNLLPHRYPFLLIDKVLDCEVKNYIRAIKNVTMNEPFFQGHFPNKPVMPGVLIIEAMAQASAILGQLTMEETAHEKISYYLVGVDKVRFRKTVEPGDQLYIHSDFLALRRNIWKFSATTKVNDTVIASAELLTTVVDSDS